MLPKKTIAWLIHLYTASGAVIGMMALIAAAREEIRLAFLLLVAAAFVDAIDGMMARRFKVSEILPKFSGAYMDDAVDVLTFIFVPIFIMGWMELLPSVYWIAVPTLAGMYAYGQIHMKTEDDFFLGFPSYWNIIALYMWWLQPGPYLAVAMIVLPSILTFIPIRYLYPSRNNFLWKTTWVLGLIWSAMVVYLLALAEPDETLVLVSLFYPAYYLLASFYLEYRVRTGRPPGRT